MTTRSFAGTLSLLAAALFLGTSLLAAPRKYHLASPDGDIHLEVSVGQEITYSISHGDILLLDNSALSMTLSGGKVLGKDEKAPRARTATVDETIPATVFKRAGVRDHYNSLTLSFKGFSLVFRAYDDGVAYRFVVSEKGDFRVEGEKASFTFAKDWPLYVPYVSQHTETLQSQFYSSFESLYDHHRLSEWNPDRLAFLPLTVEADGGLKVCITESDLLDYPGMYLYNGNSSTTLEGVFAPYPREVEQGGHNMLQGEVRSRETFIAMCPGNTSFPWRTIIISEKDCELAASDMVWRLATPSKGDFSWVRPGKVAWDWWNDWNIYGVDFRAGINNDTYKYYIDFASEHGIEYVILDEGWAVNLKADLFQVVDEIDLELLSRYAESKGVGLILWAGYWAFDSDMEKVCEHYSGMGIKGFKVDFMDRDDQQIVEFYRRAAETTARYHLLIDFHGAFKPSGLNRTYPNVINFEGVHGLENMKWSDDDQVTYDVTLPFTRCVAGPMDYTQGAMRNATRGNFHAVNSEAMSMGTRCRQLAQYIIFDSPLNMLCDSPSNYMAEKECTRFISEVPTVWDETLALDGEIAKFIVMARRRGDTWYVGTLTDWDERDLSLDLGWLGEGWKVEFFKDGVNADRAARDFSHGEMDLPSGGILPVHMAPGGGFVAKLTRK